MIQINDTTSIEIQKEIDRTTIILNKNSQKIVLSDLKTNDYFWSNVVFDENYVVVYSRGNIVNQIPIEVEADYDIKEEKILDLSNERISAILISMLVVKKGFNLANVLTFINNEDLQILNKEERGNLKRILTCGNSNITMRK